MNKEFIPYEEALAMKELGFDEECLARYCVVTEWEEPTGEILLQYTQECKYPDKNLVLAPLYQQAFRWFREKYMLSGFIIPTKINHRDDVMEYTYDIRGRYTTSVHIGTYEEAELVCLRKLIKIVKENS